MRATVVARLFGSESRKGTWPTERKDEWMVMRVEGTHRRVGRWRQSRPPPFPRSRRRRRRTSRRIFIPVPHALVLDLILSAGDFSVDVGMLLQPEVVVLERIEEDGETAPGVGSPERLLPHHSPLLGDVETESVAEMLEVGRTPDLEPQIDLPVLSQSERRD